jgi:hypothetical protein
VRKIATLALLFPILLAMLTPAGSQTRPRRVTASNETAEPETLATATERPRVTRESSPSRVSDEARREGVGKPSRWRVILTGLAIGAAAAGSSCAPSRGGILRGPRFTTQFLEPR